MAKPNLKRIVCLFERGIKMVEIAEKFDLTRQAISLRLRRYYKKKRPRVYHVFIYVRLCRVCENELIREEKVWVADMGNLKFGETVIQSKYICNDCLRLDLYRCRKCGTVGYYGPGFCNMPCKQVRTIICAICFNELHTSWRNSKVGDVNKYLREWQRNNPDKIRKYHKNYESRHPGRTRFLKKVQYWRDKGITLLKSDQKEP